MAIAMVVAMVIAMLMAVMAVVAVTAGQIVGKKPRQPSGWHGFAVCSM
jgi:hypothetical protein